jgi:hypothetical protein
MLEARGRLIENKLVTMGLSELEGCVGVSPILFVT